VARNRATARKVEATVATPPSLTSVDGHGAAALDPLIHQRTRLAIVSALAVNDVLSFNELKQSLGVSDGNLSVHTRKLEDAGYLGCRKSFAGRVPLTVPSLGQGPPRLGTLSQPHGGLDQRDP